MSAAIKWSWRHHSLSAEFYDSIEDAVLSAEFASDYGDEALQCIEVIEDDASRILASDSAEYLAIAEPRRQAEDEEYESRPKSVAFVHLRGPGDLKETAMIGGYATLDAAEKEAARLRRMLEPERVTVEKA